MRHGIIIPQPFYCERALDISTIVDILRVVDTKEPAVPNPYTVTEAAAVSFCERCGESEAMDRPLRRVPIRTPEFAEPS